VGHNRPRRSVFSRRSCSQKWARDFCVFRICISVFSFLIFAGVMLCLEEGTRCGGLPYDIDHGVLTDVVS